MYTIMSTPVETPSSQILSIAVGASAGISGPPTPTPPNPLDTHRWYRCVRDPFQTTCVQLEKPLDMLSINEGSKLVLIPKWIPAKLDRPFVSYKLWQDHTTTVIKLQQNPSEVQK
jgi:hypothetical protein